MANFYCDVDCFASISGELNSLQVCDAHLEYCYLTCACVNKRAVSPSVFEVILHGQKSIA